MFYFNISVSFCCFFTSQYVNGPVFYYILKNYRSNCKSGGKKGDSEVLTGKPVIHKYYDYKGK